MILSIEDLRALRRYQADHHLTKEQLAKRLDVGRSTILKITGSKVPVKVQSAIYQKIMQAIASNY